MDKKKKSPADESFSVGHIHLSVSDLDKQLRFYTEILGMDVTTTLPGAVFLSKDGYHHHIGLNSWGNPKPKLPNQTGLYHFALRYPTRKSLASALQNILDKKYPIDGFADHGVSEAIYLSDPEGNGIELYWDRPKDQWPKDKAGNLMMYTQSLDVEGLLSELKN